MGRNRALSSVNPASIKLRDILGTVSGRIEERNLKDLGQKSQKNFREHAIQSFENCKKRLFLSISTASKQIFKRRSIVRKTSVDVSPQLRHTAYYDASSDNKAIITKEDAAIYKK